AGPCRRAPPGPLLPAPVPGGFGPERARGAPAAAAPTGVRALGAELADAGTGQQLWGRDPGTKRPMGSVTKVMTALVVIEAGRLGRKIRGPAAAGRSVASRDASSACPPRGGVPPARPAP